MSWRIRLIGPTSAEWSTLSDEIEADLARLERHGVDLSYACTGRGPKAIRSTADARRAAPYVVATAVAAEKEGIDAVIIDCTHDPGLEDARRAVAIPVIGAGMALRSAMQHAARPICVFSGDELRILSEHDMSRRAQGAATIAIGATGFSGLVENLHASSPEVTILDPLPTALNVCINDLELL